MTPILRVFNASAIAGLFLAALPLPLTAAGPLQLHPAASRLASAQQGPFVSLGNGAVLCALNDASQLLVKLPLQNPALGKGSVLIPLGRDGSPVKAKIHNISTDG